MASQKAIRDINESVKLKNDSLCIGQLVQPKQFITAFILSPKHIKKGYSSAIKVLNHLKKNSKHRRKEFYKKSR